MMLTLSYEQAMRHALTRAVNMCLGTGTTPHFPMLIHIFLMLEYGYENDANKVAWARSLKHHVESAFPEQYSLLINDVRGEFARALIFVKKEFLDKVKETR
jgi:hypothetical protein